LLLRGAEGGERRGQAPKVLLAKGHVVADTRGQLHLRHAVQLVKSLLPAPSVLVLLRLRKELSSGSDVVFRGSRVGRRRKHKRRKCDGRTRQATR